jgi:hypothetical protein
MKNKHFFLNHLILTSLTGFLSLGLLSANLSAHEQTKNINITTEDGTTVQVRPDGSKFIQKADGTSVEEKADGTKIIKKADGTTIQVNPNGEKIIKNADGTTIEVKPGH